MPLKIGSKAPDFTLPSIDGDVRLSDFKGKTVVVYFYPKDDTPGCTAEACDFRDTLVRLKRTGAVVLGISKDSVKKHQKFAEKYDLNFPLLADEDGKTVEAYGVWVEKSMYGKKYMGIERATFLIDDNGKIAHIWNNVKVPGHVDDVLNTIKSLAKKTA